MDGRLKRALAEVSRKADMAEPGLPGATKKVRLK